MLMQFKYYGQDSRAHEKEINQFEEDERYLAGLEKQVNTLLAPKTAIDKEEGRRLLKRVVGLYDSYDACCCAEYVEAFHLEACRRLYDLERSLLDAGIARDPGKNRVVVHP